ncbi:MAG: DUF2726 domain-containing protein [Pseudomonadota bacterium]
MIDQLIVVSVVSVLLLVVAATLRVRRQRVASPEQRITSPSDNVDTVAGWPPQATRVLSVPERTAHDLLCRALPGYLVFGQLPLSRFIKVPTRYSYAQWLRRVGNHCVDLVVADPLSRVIAVIEIRSAQAPDKALRRHERVARVLETVNIPLHQWIEGELPTLAQVRELFKVGETEAPRATAANPSPHHHHAHHPAPAASAVPVDPATVTFYIANEALPEYQTQAAATDADAQAREHGVEVESASMVATAMMEGVPSRETPPTTWYDEFDNHMPPSLTLAVQDDDAAAADAPQKTDASGVAAEPASPLMLQYTAR